MDIAIINTWLLTMEGKGVGIIRNGGIGIEGDKIIHVGKMEGFNYKSADILINGENKMVVMPGLINSHFHSMLTLCRGMVHDLPEIEYMPKGLSLFADVLKGQDFLLGTKLAVLEGLRAGTTTFAEYGIGLASLLNNVYKPFNVRVVATEMITELDFSEEKKTDDLYTFYRFLGNNAFKRANKLFKQFQNDELITCMYGPNALDMVSLDLIKEIKEEAVKRNSKIHMHVAQGGRERLQIEKRYGSSMTTVKLLKEHDLLDSTLIAAHIHDTTREERAVMVRNGVKMVGCPSSISKIDGIIPPLADFIELGGIAAIGTDEAPGTGHHDLFIEMRMASLLSKVAKRDPTVLPPWTSLNLGTLGGARVLDLENKIGSLRPSKQADLILLKLNVPHLTPIIHEPFCNLAANLVYSGKGNEVDTVIINGKIILLNGKFQEIEEEKIINQANKRAQELFPEVSELWRKSGSRMVKYHEQGYI